MSNSNRGSSAHNEHLAEVHISAHDQTSAEIIDISGIISQQIASAAKKPKGKKAKATLNPAPQPLSFERTIKGELKHIMIADVVVGPRYRKDLGDVQDLADSIASGVLLTPIMVDTRLNLIHGLRRLEAHKLLGLKEVLAHIVDVPDPIFAQREEDRCRKPLTPVEMFYAAEECREDQAEKALERKRQGKKANELVKGRVEELLAEFVGISRGTYRKIKAIMDAYRQEPELYQELVDEMAREKRVDKHYRQFLAMTAAPSAAQMSAIMVDPDWQDRSRCELDEVKAALSNVAQVAAKEGTLLLLPTGLAELRNAVGILSRMRAIWQKTLLGTTPEESIWLLATFGKGETIPDAMLHGITDSCEEGSAAAAANLREVFGSEFLELKIGEQLAEARKAA